MTDTRSKAIEIICKEAEDLGYCDDDVNSFRSGEFDGDDLLTLQAVERALDVSLTSTIEALDAALLAMSRCEHDGGFDREIGPIGCNLGDKCVCIGVYPIVAKARAHNQADGPVRCPCTMFEQDESCPEGYPSMLCGICKGTGNTTQEQVTALAVEMLKIASDVGEPEDPFAAWESIDLSRSAANKATT